MDSFDNDIELSYNVEIDPNKATEIALVAVGSFTSPDECLKEYRFIRDNYNYLLEDTRNHFNNVSSSTLHSSNDTKQTPIITKLIKAFEKAKTSLEYLKAEYDELGVGICAGLPRFPNYWARDTGWSLRGYLSIGDYKFVLAVIQNLLGRQAKKNSKVAAKGELPMIISGKYFLHNTTYGSADSTFLFPWVIREYVLSTGDIEFLKHRWNDVIDLIDYGFSKDRDGDGLIENGFTGIAEKLPIQDSTWMDHIDRRKSANDIQALFYESLRIGGELAEIVGDHYNGQRWLRYARKLQSKIELEYWNGNAGFYFDTIRRDGSKDASIRPNALLFLLTSAVTDKSRAESVLSRIERDDMTTAWGIRTLSSSDPKYHPTLYHDGAVWPLVTGWAAISEMKFNRKKEALYYLESMADRILLENGMFAETYRGDRPEPFNSCILQAWSVAMYVYAISKMMLGMKLNLIENKIRFDPQIPDSLKNICTPIKFEYTIESMETISKNRMLITVDPANEKLLVIFKDRSDNKKPYIFSNSYSVDVRY
jgi:glycogen debranching enzyme